MKTIKTYLTTLITIVIIMILVILFVKFNPFKNTEPEYNLVVDLSPEQIADLEFRLEENFKRLELFPNTYEVFIDLGNIEKSLGHASKAINYYTRAWEIIPANSTPWINIGNVYLSLKMYDKAEEAFLKAKNINPAYPINYLNLADLYQNYLKDKSDQIRGIYLEGLATVEKDEELLVPFATYLYESHNYSEAKLYFERLKEMYPERTDFQEMIDLINQQIAE